VNRLKGGAKAKIEVGALPPLRGRTKASKVIAFIELYVITPSGHGAGKPMKLAPWQKRIIRAVFTPGVRQALVSLPRGNGKTTLSAAIALAQLFDPEAFSPAVVCVASTQKQAEILLHSARRMVELSPALSERANIYKDSLRAPQNDGSLVAYPSESDALQGLSFDLCVVDELHVVDETVWEAMTLASGKRESSVCLAISTPSNSRNSVMWKLVEYARANIDPAFAFVEYSAPDGCSLTDEKAWRQANPALGSGFLAIDSFRALQKTTRESSFRRFRLGMWIEHDESWLPSDRWKLRADKKRVVRREPVVLGFDGSASDDSTALVGCTLDNHLFVVKIWTKPVGAPDGWRVPRAEVAKTVESAMHRYTVRELSADPFEWRSEIEQWASRWPRKVVEFPCSSWARMAPATDRFTQAVMEGQLTHDGDRTLTEHVQNCRMKSTPSGEVIVKDARNSPRKIDAAVAAVMALHRAAFYAQRKPSRLVAV
jgi:phage terminase large subunit-like protein